MTLKGIDVRLASSVPIYELKHRRFFEWHTESIKKVYTNGGLLNERYAADIQNLKTTDGDIRQLKLGA